MMERSEAIIRFHALQSKSKQAPVIPWRLELDMKDHRHHAMMAALVHSSVWQLIQVRLKPHHLQQSKMADELMKHKEEVDRKGLCLALSTTHLVNDEVQCFANAVYLTVMWTHVMCSAFTMGSWGLVTTTFLTTLIDGKRSPLCLRSHPMLQSGLAQWQQLRGERANVQQDSWGGSAALMLHRPLADVSAVPMKWSLKQKVRDPILLYYDLWSDLRTPKNWQYILDKWRNTNGMIQALELASHILPFQICRFIEPGTSDRSAFDFGNLRT